MKVQSRKFVYYLDTRTGKTLEMNLWEWENIHRDVNLRKYRDLFQFIREVNLDSPLNHKPEKLDIVDDPLECPICGFIAETEVRLKNHKKKVHA